MINPFTHRKILRKGRPGRARITAFAMPERGSSSQNIPMTLEVHVEGLPPYEVEDQWMVSSKDTLGFGLELPVKVDADKPDRVAIDWEAARGERANEKQARQANLAAQPPVGSSPTAAPGAAAGPVQDPLAAAGGLAGMLGAQPGNGSTSSPSIDARNDPELRAKLEQALGRKLEPGTQESIDVSNDPALAATIIAIVQQHAAEKASGGAASHAQPVDPAGGDDALDKLERLAKLRESGALTEEEFNREKRQLLDGI